LVCLAVKWKASGKGKKRKKKEKGKSPKRLAECKKIQLLKAVKKADIKLSKNKNKPLKTQI